MLQRFRFPLLMLTVVVASVSVGLVIRQWTGGGDAGSDNLEAVEARIELLAGEVAAGENTPDPAASYRPQVVGDITAIDAPAGDILRHLPCVACVEVRVAVAKPTHRIIHLRDWHLVAREDYRAALRAGSSRAISPEEGDLLMDELRLQVAIVQAEQLALLRCLAQHHGLKHVLAENATAQGIDDFRKRLESLRTVDRSLARLVQSRGEVDGATAIDHEIAELRRGHQLQLLEVSAAGRLAVEGLAEVLPLEDERVFEAGYPFGPDGKYALDPAKLEPRHAAEVKAAMASGQVAVIVLGASHDLSAACAQAGGGVEYIRVTTTAVERFAGKDEP